MSPPLEQVFLAQPIGIGKAQIIATPFQFEFTGEDRLAVAVSSSVDTVIALTMRFIRDDGEIDVAQHAFNCPGDRVRRIFSFSVGHGYVSNVVTRAVNETIQIGQCYVTVFVVRTGGTAPGVIIGQMLGGYSTLQAPLSWPGSAIVAPSDGAGAQVSIAIPTPNPTTSVNATVPINTRWAVQSFFAQFQTDPGSAGTGTFRLVYSEGGITTATIAIAPPQAANTIMRYTYGRGLGNRTDADTPGYFVSPLIFDGTLNAGGLLEFSAPLVSSPDTFTNAALRVQEWLTP